MSGGPNRLTRRLSSDNCGAALVEFAIVAPVLCLFLMGAFDVAHTLYLRATLSGILQKTARDATLETSGTAEALAILDNRVKAQVLALVNNATIPTPTRRYYRTFAEAAAARAEQLVVDNNNNGRCDAGDSYMDANNNNTWDEDGGNAGQGGAKDATLYTFTVQYKSMFPLWSMVGFSPDREVTAKTILRNQPYSDQDSYTAAVRRTC